MARTQTLLNLRLQARQRADRETSTFVTDAEVNEFINQSWAETYEVICESGEDYYLQQSSFSTVAGTDTYALPDAHYKTRGVDVVGTDGSIITAKRFNFAERNMYQVPGFWTFGNPISFAVEAQNLVFRPIPGGVYPVVLWYYPAPARMTDDGETIDGVAGWEEAAVLDAAIKILEKEGKSGEPNALAMSARLAQEKARIRTMSSTRVPGVAPRVARSRYVSRISPRYR